MGRYYSAAYNEYFSLNNLNSNQTKTIRLNEQFYNIIMTFLDTIFVINLRLVKKIIIL